MSTTGIETDWTLLREVEQFLFREAELLDDREFEQWLDTLAEDVTYRIPIVRNVSSAKAANEYLEGTLDVSWMDEDKWTLSKRVEQIRTGVHWAEEPLSRTTHVVSNVRIADIIETEVGEELDVRSAIVSYRQRLLDQEDTVIGRRRDVLRRTDDGLLIAKRTIYINQPVFLASSLSHFL
jgi:3-phenylpropionate/cinnamic acid dioxygenase small subunit